MLLLCTLTRSMSYIEDFFRKFDTPRTSTETVFTGTGSDELINPYPYTEEPASKICNPRRRCMLNPCINVWSEWSEWTACSHICGKGLRTRNRQCIATLGEEQVCDGDNVQFQPCFLRECKDSDYLFMSGENIL